MSNVQANIHMPMWAKVALGVILTPIVLVVLLAVALYLPPVQKWAVDKASEYASRETGMEISVGGVHLAFPLDLSLEEVKCLKQNDSLPQVKDTILLVKQAVVDVQLLPLLNSNVVINQIELNQGHFNTSDFIHEARVKGYVGRLLVDNTPPPVASVALDSSVVRLSSIILTDARVNVELADTVPPDTTETENLWKIYVRDLSIQNSKVTVHMPGDTLQVGAMLADAKAKEGYFDLNKGLYQVNHLALAKSAITYDNNFEGRVPHSTNYLNAFDANHIALSDINLKVDSIYYCDPAIRLKIREAAMKEKCGLALNSLKADVAIDSTQMKVDGALATNYSKASINLNVKPTPNPSLKGRGTYDDLFDFDNNSVDAKVDGEIGYQDLKMILSSNVQGFKSSMVPMYPLSVKGEVHGNMRQMTIREMNVNWPTALTADARGTVSMKPSIVANIHTDVRTYNLNFVKGMLDKSTARMINIPAMRASADVVYRGPTPSPSLKGGGHLNANIKAYEGKGVINAQISSTIPPSLQGGAGGRLDINAKARGVNVNHFVKGYNLSNVDADVKLHGGKLTANVDSHAGDVVGNFNVAGTMGSRMTDLTIATDLNKVDLYRLKIADKPLTIALCSNLDIETDMDQYYKVQGMVSDISFTDTATINLPDDIALDILTRKDTTMAKVDCGDFALRLNAQGGYKWLMGCGDRLQTAIEKQLKARTIDQQALRASLPRLTLSVHSEQDNPVYRSLKYMGIDYSLIDLNMKTSREDGIFSDMVVHGLKTQGYKLDTITVSVGSRNDPMQIYYRAHIHNRPPNDYVFNAYIDGKLLEHGIVTGVRLFDEKDNLALRLGAEATMEENGIKLHFVPQNPTLGYDIYTLNDDNYVLLDKQNRIHAYIDLLAQDGTGLKLYDNINDNGNGNDNGNDNDYLQDLTLSVNRLNIGKVLSSLPYAVNMQGMLDGDFHVMQNKDETFTLASDLTIKNMVYEGCNMGNIGTEFTYLPKSDGSHYIDGIILKDDVQVGDITGSYNFNTSAINAKMNFDKFPLDLINGFVPDQLIGLEGLAEGTLDIQGTTSKPVVNGELDLRNAALLSVPYGVRLRFDDKPVRIHNSSLLFEDFRMYATNDQPMVVQGSVNFGDLDHITTDLRLRAEDFALIDAKENSKSEAYGNLNVNCFAKITGELDRLNVRGRLDVLSSTNLYYILRDSPITTDNRLKELVTFTDFTNNDTITMTRPTVQGMNMVMSIAVREGAHIKCWLDGAHSNYLDLIGNGELRYSLINEEEKMTGRYTITEGEMKYSLPVIPLKTFTIEDGSYIEWTGEMMNPRLHITAKETVKANVNIDGVNQMVTFLTGIKLSKTLNDMGLEFTIEAPENQTISDELSMKSAEERGKLAVTMLTTGMYLSDGNTSNFSMNSAMNSFLQSQINNIAGNALRTVDISFGMESSTEQDGTMHNDYTFKFAKRFWNNRLSIAVGGKVSSGPDVSGQNKSFFNNVDLHYRLSDTSNQYLQMFYKRSVYDYLEGYLSQYGAGYMWKKKSQTLKGIFQKEPKMQFRRTTSPARQDSSKVKTLR